MPLAIPVGWPPLGGAANSLGMYVEEGWRRRVDGKTALKKVFTQNILQCLGIAQLKLIKHFLLTNFLIQFWLFHWRV